MNTHEDLLKNPQYINTMKYYTSVNKTKQKNDKQFNDLIQIRNYSMSLFCKKRINVYIYVCLCVNIYTHIKYMNKHMSIYMYVYTHESQEE